MSLFAAADGEIEIQSLLREARAACRILTGATQLVPLSTACQMQMYNRFGIRIPPVRGDNKAPPRIANMHAFQRHSCPIARKRPTPI